MKDSLPNNSDAAMRALFASTMDKMLMAGWLRSHAFIDGKGFHLVWTPLGSARSQGLKLIADAYGIETDTGPTVVEFHKLGETGALPPGVLTSTRHLDRLDPFLVEQWNQAVEELQIAQNPDALMAMVHICRGWAPGPDTPLTIGP
jgi:hypothetical protein